MQGKYVALSIILLLSLFVGCAEPPKSPLSSIPMILIDHIEETDETKVFVHGIEDHLFSNITIMINNDMITENFTYSLHISTSLSEFELFISVWDKQKNYEYSGEITVFNDNGEIKIKVQDTDHDEPVEESLPHTIVMERD